MQELEYVEIESIECVGEDQTYDIEMEEWPSFVANGFIVHNSGMRNLLKQMAEGGPLDFNDLCAATALFRPGPLDAGLCDRYIQVKQGTARPFYEHPRLVSILEKTLGVMAYQEQTMKVAQVIAGFTPGEADGVRKAIGKKDAKKMAELGDQFVAGAVAGYAEVELEDGSKVEVHRLKKLRCTDGKLRTIDEAMAAESEIVSFI